MAMAVVDHLDHNGIEGGAQCGLDSVDASGHASVVPQPFGDRKSLFANGQTGRTYLAP
jgi:hypothetical protein